MPVSVMVHFETQQCQHDILVVDKKVESSGLARPHYHIIVSNLSLITHYNTQIIDTDFHRRFPPVYSVTLTSRSIEL